MEFLVGVEAFGGGRLLFLFLYYRRQSETAVRQGREKKTDPSWLVDASTRLRDVAHDIGTDGIAVA